jgi:hypothetical protein
MKFLKLFIFVGLFSPPGSDSRINTKYVCVRSILIPVCNFTPFLL